MKPLFVAPYGPNGASSRARVYDWVNRLGLDAEIHDYLGTRRLGTDILLRNASKLVMLEIRLRQLARTTRPHLFLHREASPFGRGHVEQAILQSAGVAVYDFDDALMWEPPGGVARKLVMSRARKCRVAVEHADVVIAGNDVLADWASNYARDVRVIPTCIEPAEYPVKADYAISDPPRIGWLGSPSTEMYLREVTEPLLEFNRRTGARLLVISGGNSDLGALRSIVDRVEWSLTSYASFLATADVAIAPLTDTPYAQGKCAYKMLQYAAIGLPIVASPVGANAVAGDRLGARLVSGSGEWLDGLAEIVGCATGDRGQNGKLARRAVSVHYSYQAWQAEWLLAQGIQDGRYA